MVRPHDDPDLALPMLAAAPWLLGMAAFSECLTLFAWHPRRGAMASATHDLPVPEPLDASDMPELFA